MNVFDSHMYNWHSRTVIIIADISSLFSFGSFFWGGIAVYMYTIHLLCRSQAYTAWVNSQLRKRPELPLIEDMGNDLQDGVLVAKLIEIISKCFVLLLPSFLLCRFG
jgi:hypothetical protein